MYSGFYFLIVGISVLFATSVAWSSSQKNRLSPEELFADISALMTSGQADSAYELALAHPVPAPEDGNLDERYGTYLLNLGWIELTRRHNENAIGYLENARRFWPNSFWLPVYLSQACHALSRFDCVWSEFNKVPEWFLKQQHGIAIIAADSSQRQGRPERSWAILSKMRLLAPDSKQIFSARVLLAASLGLSSEVVDLLTDSFGTGFQPVLQADDYGSILAALHDMGYSKEVLKILEIAHARFPQNAALHMLNGIIFDNAGDSRLAAHWLAQAATFDSKFAHDAALLLSRIDEVELALSYNSLVQDRVKKLEQRAILYLQMGDFERLTGLEKSLASAGLLQRDDLRYALAFAHYQGGRLQSAQQLLTEIDDARLFEKATILRGEIAKRCAAKLVVDCE